MSEADLNIHQDGVNVMLSVECGLAQEVKVASWKKSKKQKRRDMTLVLMLTSDHAFVDFRRISCVLVFILLMRDYIVYLCSTSCQLLALPLCRA